MNDNNPIQPLPGDNMTDQDFRLRFEVIALPYWDQEAEQWYPSVKILCNGEFHQWIVYELGFDEARFTMPYAQDFARGEASIIKETIRQFQEQQMKRFKGAD